MGILQNQAIERNGVPRLLASAKEMVQGHKFGQQLAPRYWK